MVDDRELLRQYAKDHSQGAFAQIVDRYVDFVYAAALRFLGGDEETAKDVTQEVFVDLARKAPRLGDRPLLAGWLHKAVQFEAVSRIRTEHRRRAREKEFQMTEEYTRDDVLRTDWDRVRPFIDGAIAELPSRDREAVLLRFFRSQAYAEIGLHLGLTESGARVRVERALHKLSVVLSKRGITSTGAALALGLNQAGAVIAPQGLSSVIIAASLAAKTASVVPLSALIISHAKTIAAGVVVIAGALTLVVQSRLVGRLSAQMTDLRSENQAMPEVRRRNADLLQERSEIAQLRAPRSQLRMLQLKVAKAFGRDSKDTANAVGPKSGFVAIGNLHNRGNQTASDTLESIFWAREHCEIAGLERLTLFPSAVREAAQKAYDQLTPEQVRILPADANTPERVMLLKWILSNRLTAVKFEIEEQTAPDQSYLSGYQQYEDGTTQHVVIHLVQGVNGWQWPMGNDEADFASLKVDSRTKPTP